jgi:hypothetical protein
MTSASPAIAFPLLKKTPVKPSLQGTVNEKWVLAEPRHQNAMFPMRCYCNKGCSRPATLDLNLVLAALRIWTKATTRNTLP